MARYRYRTAVLTGQWRATYVAAARDAVKAKQALTSAGEGGGLHWLVPGEIEREDGPGAAGEKTKGD